MQTIPSLEPAATSGDVRAILDAIGGKLGGVPNLFRVLAHSPSALGGYVALADVTAKGRLTAQQRELIAMAVADANHCEYCLAAHTALGGMVGLKPEQLAKARSGAAATPFETAVLRLSRQIITARGQVDAEDLAAYRAAGLDDGLILDVLLVTVLNLFTNYANHIAATTVDFPTAPAAQAA
jgi:uncharacterized peroxidase-related enzyme